MKPRHIYSIFIFFNLEPNGPFKYGPLIFDNEPIYVCYGTSDDDAYELSKRFELRRLPYVETFTTGRTIEEAEAIVERLKAMIGTEDEGGPLKEFIEDNKKKRQLTEEHKAAISRSLKGHSVSNRTREKISKTTTGRKKPWLHGNTHRSNQRWIITSPAGGREFHVNNLTGFCRKHELSPSNLMSVAQQLRRHYKFWKCRRVDWL